MKRIYTIIAAALLVTAVQAQDNMKSNYLGLNLGAGMNTISYNPIDGAYTPGLGFGAGIQYAHFFGQHFGFGLGVQYAVHNAATTYNKEIVGDLTVHPGNGYSYYPIAKYNNWRERQTMNVVSIPVEVMWRTAMGNSWAFLVGLGAKFDINAGARYDCDGSYETQGRFVVNGNTYAINNLPAYGFDVYDENNLPSDKGIDVNKNGVSVIADLGVNHSFSDNWGLYIGVYGSYGLSNLYDDANANNELLVISPFDYNSTLASDRVDAYNLVAAGVKIGVNFGWNCKHGSKGDDGRVPYSSLDNKQTAAQAAAEKAAAEKAAADKIAADKAAAEKAAADKAAAEKLAAEKAAADAARQASYANDAALAEAMQKIDADIAAAEEMANQSGSSVAKSDVSKAKAKAKQAKEAYNNGRYADAYDLMKEAYALLAHSYAVDADAFAKKGNSAEAAQAASAAATYADAARNGDLSGAMAATNNARSNSEKAAKNMSVVEKKAEAAPVVDNANKKAVTDMASFNKNITLINSGIHFDFNESNVIVDGNGINIALRAIATAMAADKNLKVTCIGHTDSIGGEAYNQGLGMRRAKALKAMLVEYGAPARNISTKSAGKNEPVAPNDTEENRARNRRAVIELKK